MKAIQRRKVQDLLLERVANGETKADACAALGINRRTVSRWVAKDAVFADRWSAARVEQAHSLADAAVRIANEPVAAGDMVAVQRNRLRVDTLKWLTSKIAPRLYGDKIIAEHTVRQAVVILPALAGSGAEPTIIRATKPATALKPGEE